MAMVRLPTRLSGGKANLHQGAIGVGVNLATGTTFGGVFHNDAIDYHPDTMQPIDNITVCCHYLQHEGGRTSTHPNRLFRSGLR